MPIMSKIWMKLSNTTTSLLSTNLNPVPNAQVCVFDGTYYKITTTNYIFKTSLHTTFRMYPPGPFPKPLYIPHIPHVSMETLAAENLDVCTDCDPWDSNIQLTMGKDRRRLLPPHLGLHLEVFIPKKEIAPAGGWGVTEYLQLDWMDDETDGWMKKASQPRRPLLYVMMSNYSILLFLLSNITEIFLLLLRTRLTN